ncbi:hypothetical protein [Acinetobacter haemolyticus]|uniref:hypothetical protein n=1 Tax=Acinetobacter haemolyticus TaxID=29430 RepID=UPI003F574862
MNAIQFIQQHGVDRAREVVDGAPEGAELFHTNMYIKNAHSEGYTDHFARWSDGFEGWVNASADREFIDESIDLSDLKRLVESVDLVELLGGIEALKGLVDISNSPFSLSHITREGVIHQIDEIKQAIADYEAIGGEHV